jgi:hypothetical protein
VCACVMPSEVKSCYEIFLFSSSRLGEAILLFYGMTEITVMMDRLINLRVLERESRNNIGGATNGNRHQRDVEYEWTRKESVPKF